VPEVIITIPAYNEERTIRGVINDLQDTISIMLPQLDYRIMVISDGSEDKTIEEASKTGAMVFSKDHSGLADTFRLEMEKALEFESKYIVHTDADGQYTAVDVCRLVQFIRSSNCDLVLGNRLGGRIEYMPTSKRIFNRLGSLFFSIALWEYVPDFTTGLRVFTPRVAQLSIVSKYTYTVEQIVKAHLFGYRIKSLPIEFKARRDGKSKLMRSPYQYLWNTIKNYRKMFKV